MNEDEDFGIAELFGLFEVIAQAARLPGESQLARVERFIKENYGKGRQFTIPEIIRHPAMAGEGGVPQSIIYRAVQSLREQKCLTVLNAEMYQLRPTRVFDITGFNAEVNNIQPSPRQEIANVIAFVRPIIIEGDDFSVYDIIYDENGELRFSYSDVAEAIQLLVRAGLTGARLILRVE